MSYESKPITNKMCGFALNLDLTIYFEDLRKYSSVFVDLSKFKKVSDVEKHIKCIFKLEDSICLTNKKFLIPSCEDIQILQHYETLKVQKCDFFDQQIHKNKRTNPDCDQDALNLIQTERTIDLSCRPKQRLKINVCKNHSFSGTSLTPFVENAKIQSIPRLSTSSNSVFDEPCQIKNKEKRRNKIKARDSSKDENDMNNDVENSVDILDMSVNKPMKNNYKNCFSVEREFEIEPPSKLCKKNNTDNPFGINLENTIDECHRKSKKRRKQLKAAQDYMDPSNTYWDTFASDNGSTLSENAKRHKKKSKKISNIEGNEFITDLAEDGNQFRDEDDNDLLYNQTISDDVFRRKKHKKKKKSAEFTENLDYSDFMCNGKVQVPERCTESYVKLLERSDLKNIQKHSSKKEIEEYKGMLFKKFDKLLAECQVNSNRFNPTNEEIEDSSIKKSKKLNTRDVDIIINSDKDESKSEGKEEESMLDTIINKDNFLRKHKETKKGSEDFPSNIYFSTKEKVSEVINESNIKSCQKSCTDFISKKDFNDTRLVDDEQETELFKLLVESNRSSLRNGSVENSCNTSSEKVENHNDSKVFSKENSNDERNVNSYTDSLETKSRRKRIRRHNKKKKRETKAFLSAVGPVLNKITSEIQVKASQSLSETGKHIFFNDNDVPETIISSTPQSVLQDTSADIDTGYTEVITTEQDAKHKSTTWQEELLKLSCNSSKPVVFHRSTALTPEKLTPPSEPTPALSLVVNNCNALHIKSVIKDHNSKSLTVNTELERTHEVSEKSNSCNGETNAANVSQVYSGTEHNYSEVKKLPEVVKPLPNDIQNIILTNYPIIDKVVAEDLILFKVLKLNENNREDSSKTILAKVNSTSIFPEKICLQILEGCEECGSCKKVHENGETFLIELHWTDILEPRLFYP